mgnify:CR=1 FL=1|tara:strand:+ start:377 stop:727 length:351 start_codon:yes stop_codon:yes gene_type:complete
MNNINLTSREALVLRTFLPQQNVNDFGEGVYTKMNFLTMDIFDKESTLLIANEMKGVLGSLVKKGLLFVDYECGSEKGFGILEELETPTQFIWLGAMFEDNQELLEEVLSLAKETK